MKVKLIQSTQNPIDVMWVAARTCYSEKSPIEMWGDADYRNKPYSPGDPVEIHSASELKEHENKKWNLVKKVLESGHSSIAEHCYFTFAIEGISRSCSHQLVRHRAGIVFSQQSQRYVEIKEDYQSVGDDGTITNENNYLERTDLIEILDKYFVWDHNNYAQYHALLQSLYCYLFQVQELKTKPEDARQVLPNATKTNITMSLNYRELIHICNLRLCTRAQLEIRQLFKAIKEEVNKVEPRLADLLVPSCEVHGMCFEAKCCGRKPKADEIKGAYKLLSDDTILSKEDWEQLMISINNPPEVNEKLKALLEMKSVIDE